MDKDITEIDKKLTALAAKIGSKSHSDSAAIITLKNSHGVKKVRIYCASPGTEGPTHAEAAGILREMAKAFNSKAEEVENHSGEFKEVKDENQENGPWYFN